VSHRLGPTPEESLNGCAHVTSRGDEHSQIRVIISEAHIVQLTYLQAGGQVSRGLRRTIINAMV
jgi:hypothetical protein